MTTQDRIAPHRVGRGLEPDGDGGAIKPAIHWFFGDDYLRISTIFAGFLSLSGDWLCTGFRIRKIVTRRA
jgi:hypothetical protein